MSPANPNDPNMTPPQPFTVAEPPPGEGPVPAPMNADEIRHRILEQFNTFAPHLNAYQEYATRIAALSVQYHNSRLTEVFGLPIQEEILLATLDARETPKTLDAKLAQIAQVPDTKIKRIVFDRVKATYYLYI